MAVTPPLLLPHRPHHPPLENLIFASSPEPKGQLTRNLVGSIGHLENLVFASSLNLKGQLTQNLVGSIGVIVGQI